MRQNTFKSMLTSQPQSFSALAVMIVLVGTTSARSDSFCKEIGSDWVWFSDHVALWVSYVTEAAPNRKYAVGTGVSIGGKPRGQVREVSGKVETTAYGAGALHVRFVDNLGTGTVCAAQGNLKATQFIDEEF